jgi:Pyridoxamine 5'-phosphate oxidase
MSSKEKNELPKEVVDVLKTTVIGYLSVRSEKGELYTYPVAYYFSGSQLYMMTPKSSAKLKFMRANPEVSFLVDNKGLTLGAIGAMVQGRAKIYTVGGTIKSILSIGPNIAKYAKKYPDQFTFYLSGKYLPDERKVYKYRFVRIDPTKILYWVGYKYGRYKGKGASPEDPFEQAPDDVKMETFSNLMKSADEEFPAGDVPSQGPEWQQKVDDAVQTGAITQEEREAMGSFRGFLRQAAEESKIGPAVSSSEKNLLKKWKTK